MNALDAFKIQGIIFAKYRSYDIITARIGYRIFAVKTVKLFKCKDVITGS